LRGNRTLFLLIFASEQPTRIPPHDTAGHKAALHAAFRGVGWECPEILAALDRCREVYFDDVSQIRMSAWSKGRVVLLGDAAFCPSLLAGQGSALAMIGAYVLAGELGMQPDNPEASFRRYEVRLHDFMEGKQTDNQSFRHPRHCAENFPRAVGQPQNLRHSTYRGPACSRVLESKALFRISRGKTVRSRVWLGFW
jgi:2-polyprenyl-6-methoxyphenol hydroxylase-like FAD-dependent oxidoreductase